MKYQNFFSKSDKCFIEVTAIRISRHYDTGLEGLVTVSRTLDDIQAYDDGDWEMMVDVNQTESGNYYVLFDPPVNATAIKLNVSNPNHVIDEMQIWVKGNLSAYDVAFCVKLEFVTVKTNCISILTCDSSCKFHMNLILFFLRPRS